ncbi:flagellar assembly protein H [Nereida ignava]|uniref:Flagellar assembly protein FliH n=1 Tax=Nereida ignava TaxID=282199 RepID=A0A0U1NN38_9RHOB|nr:FliH/SctL family protein [Nereida ignava]CRK76128.1 flagellar assembly protein H [Nereida ignava]SFJ56741.1 flagellar assembly protein FliH [Nereida ignava DSM 16309]
MTGEFIPHQGAIHADEIVQGVPLKQSEISRFIRAIDAEGYQKSDNTLVKPEGAFKPKSLLDLAKEAAEREPVVVPEPSQPKADNVIPEAAPETHDADPQPQDVSDLAGRDALVEPEITAPLDAQPSSDVSDATTSSEGQESEIPEIGPAEPTTEPLPQPVSTEDYEAAKAQAYEQGLEAGKQEVRDQVEAMMSHALGLLEQTVEAFAEQADGAVEELATTIEQSVNSLASSRAGAQIETTPTAFAARVQKLVERVKTATDAPIIRLHPSDVMVLRPVLEQSSALLNLRLVGDETLQRGDVDLSLEGVRLTDVLPRIESVQAVIEYVPLTLAEDALHGAAGTAEADLAEQHPPTPTSEADADLIGPQLPDATEANPRDT